MLTSRYMKGWGFPYEQWPQDLKDEYAYNPTMAKTFWRKLAIPKGLRQTLWTDAVKDLDLLKIVQSYFNQVNIDMEINVMDAASFAAFIQKGRKHDQLVHHPPGPLVIRLRHSLNLPGFLKEKITWQWLTTLFSTLFFLRPLQLPLSIN